MELKSKSVLVYDYGLFTEVANRLARDFGTVYYFVPWADAFPKSNKCLIGHEFDNIERIQNFEDYVDKVDMILFPDTHSASMVEMYKRLGYNVAGVGRAEELELNRILGREVQHQIGADTQKTVVAYGLDDLRNILKNEKDKFVKLNIFRGEIESFNHIDYQASEPLLNHLAYELGPKSDEMEFVVEDKVDGIEPGLDSIIWDGEVLNPTMLGYEIKGGGYIGKVMPYSQVPIQVKDFQDRIAPILKSYNYRFFFSSEIRIPDKKHGYMIDYCCRLAAPVPNAIQQELIENYSEVMWGLATGEKIAPKVEYKYAAGAAISSEWALKNWVRITLPKDKNERRWFKFRAGSCFDGEYYAVPPFETVLTVIAVGNSIHEVVKKVQERTEEVKGYMLDKSAAEFTDVLKEIKEGEQYGVYF